MPRVQARVSTDIWDDPDFIALSCSAQRLYLFLLSQKSLQVCGLLPFQPNKWVKRAKDWAPESLIADLAALEESRFIVCDLENDELLIRSLMRNDRVSPGNPKLWKAALGQVAVVTSERLRSALDEEVARILERSSTDTPSEDHRGSTEGVSEEHGSSTDAPRTRAGASTVRRPSTDFHLPPSDAADAVERFATVYVREASRRGTVKNPRGLRAHVLRTWSPWVRGRVATGLYTIEKLVDMAFELGDPPHQSPEVAS